MTTAIHPNSFAARYETARASYEACTAWLAADGVNPEEYARKAGTVLVETYHMQYGEKAEALLSQVEGLGYRPRALAIKAAKTDAGRWLADGVTILRAMLEMTVTRGRACPECGNSRQGGCHC